MSTVKEKIIKGIQNMDNEELLKEVYTLLQDIPETKQVISLYAGQSGKPKLDGFQIFKNHSNMMGPANRRQSLKANAGGGMLEYHRYIQYPL